MQELKFGTQSSASQSAQSNNSNNIFRFFLSVLIFCIAFGDAIGQGCLPAQYQQ
jgi:hypothetical protein